MTEREGNQKAFEWQIGIWNHISDIYFREIDQRFVSVVDAVIARASLRPGESVLDLGTGTGQAAEKAAAIVAGSGNVVGVEISPDVLAQAQKRRMARGLTNVTLREWRGERIPADDHTFDVVLCSLAIMYVIDREAAARETALVLRPSGRLIAAVWAGPDECDAVRFQQTAGRFAGPPPVPGVGPGAMADPATFLHQLSEVGIKARVETDLLGFDFPDFDSAWKALAGVTTAHLPAQRQEDARRAVLDAMYPRGDGPRHFRNLTQFIVGQART